VDNWPNPQPDGHGAEHDQNNDQEDDRTHRGTKADSWLTGHRVRGIFFATYGFLLAFRPQSFLKFHNTFVDRSRWSHWDEWQNHVHEGEYKVVGLVFCAAGIFMLCQMAFRLARLCQHQ